MMHRIKQTFIYRALLTRSLRPKLCNTKLNGTFRKNTLVNKLKILRLIIIKKNIMSKDKLKKWEVKRLQTFIMFCLLFMVNGMKYCLFIETCWVYVKKQLSPKRPYLIYSTMVFSRYLAAAIFNFPLTYWHDRTRKTKLIMISVNFLSIIGSFVYIVNNSFLFPLVGTILLGSPWLMQPVAVGEMSRAYPPKDVTQKLPLLTLASYVGYFPAALFLYTTKNLQLHVGPFLIKYENALGVIMAVFYIMLQVLTVFFVHDLSLEHDLKSDLLSQETNIQENGEVTEVFPAGMNSPKESLTDHSVEKHMTEYDTSKTTMLKNLKRLLTNADVLLVYGLVLLFYFSGLLLFNYLPIVVEKKLGYDIQIFNILLLIYGLILIMFIPFVVKVKIGSKLAFITGSLSFVLLIMILICLQGINRRYTKPQNVGLLALVMILFSFVYIGEDVFLTCTVSKFVKPDIQSFADGVRSMCVVLGRGFGNLSIILIVTNEQIVFAVLLTLLICFTMILLYRRNTLMKPEPVV